MCLFHVLAHDLLSLLVPGLDIGLAAGFTVDVDVDAADGGGGGEAHHHQLG